MVTAPVVVFVYNRLDHTRKMLEALRNNRRAKNTDLYIFSDYAKSEKSLHTVLELRQYIEEFKKKGGFKSINIIHASQNKGLANSVISGVGSIINKYGYAIVIEDDLITSIDFLDYMNSALEYYKDSNRIWSISGYTFPMSSLASYNEDVYFSVRGSSWGWATWADRWNTVDWKVTNYPDFIYNYRLRKKFNRGGNDMSGMLDTQMEGKIDSWAIRWCYEQCIQNCYTVYPSESRVINIGTDGSGTHSGNTNKFDTSIKNEHDNCKFIDLQINENIIKEFRKKYSIPLTIRFKHTIKLYIFFFQGKYRG